MIRLARGIVWSLAIYCLCADAQGQQPSPIADDVDTQLVPTGISNQPVGLNAKLASVFKDKDGTNALHLVGEFQLRLGGNDGPMLLSQEAVVWMRRKTQGKREYTQLHILLWREAEVREGGGTVTSGPALFVTMGTFGEVALNADDVTFRPTLDSFAYREGNAIRSKLEEKAPTSADKTMSVRVLDASGLLDKEQTPKPKPLIRIRSEGDIVTTTTPEGRRALTIIGGVYLSRGLPESGQFLEVQADSVVVFFPPTSLEGEDNIPPQVGLGTDATPGGAPRDSGAGSDPNGQRMSTGLGELEVEGAYLEGDVRMTQGANRIRASRLYYDFRNDRAVILDAAVRSMLAKRNIPLYLRAAEVRQLSRQHYTASDAVLTTSEFHTPHYHVGAGRIELIDRSPSDPASQKRGAKSGTFNIRHATLNLGGKPILYWPYIRGNLDTSETANRNIRGGYSDDFGLELETDWHLFNVLGFVTPEGFDSTLSFDLYTRRGPAAGIDSDYKRDRYFGSLRSYLLFDSDEDFLGRERQEQSKKDLRGRFLLRHRQYMDDDWQVSLELAYISDRGFLEEFFESEFDNEKEQETLVYAKKQTDNWAFTIAYQRRIMEFTTQTERLPDLSFHVAGATLGESVRATWYSENRLGFVRYRPADQTFIDFLRNGRTKGSGAVGRVDSRQEISIPLDFGPIRLVPFFTLRGSAWDDSPDRGGVGRILGSYGVRGNMYLTRTDPAARSSIFDIDGIRHIVKPEFIAWASHSNRDPDELFPFDDFVEQIDEVDGVSVGLRQRWQTHRGRGENRRMVDFFTWDLEAGLFNGADPTEITNGFTSISRPENSISRNYVNSSVIWRVNDRTALLSELNYDINDGEVDLFNLSLTVERSPRLSYLVGYRYIEESDSELLGFDLNYRLTEKHTLAIRELVDLDRGRTLDLTVALIRKFPRWFGAVSFALDEAEDDFGISVSIWPEGLPKAALGSRRFTTLGSTTSLERN